MRYDEVRELLVSLAKQESPETELQEEEPLIHSFIRGYVAPWLADVGVQEVSFDSAGNLLTRIGPGSGPSVLFLSYAMNHAPEGMPDPYSGAVLDGARFGLERECVWGRGLCEQKGAMAAMMIAVRAVVRSGTRLAGDLYFAVATSGESGRHDSVARLIEESGIRPGVCVLGIGTTNRICLGNQGNVKVIVTIHGRSAHVTQRSLGMNAIYGAIALIERASAIVPPVTHPELGSPLVTVEGIRSEPFGESTIPAVCEVAIDRRLLPGESPDAAFAALRDAIGGVPGYEVTARMGTFQYGGEISRMSTSYRLLADAVQSVLGRSAQDFFSAAALDAGYLIQAGIETVQFGPGDMRFAHSVEEVISVREVWEAARILAHATYSHLRNPTEEGATSGPEENVTGEMTGE